MNNNNNEKCSGTDSEPKAIKPPLGLVPKLIWFDIRQEYIKNVINTPLVLNPESMWLEDRKVAVEGAIARYEAVKMDVPMSWVTELEDLKSM